ncbi:MAG: dienelactone hydrolase [Chloroflexi bacterium]|nr:dienelactone hydrolase [Chloroflexota bacterium]
MTTARLLLAPGASGGVERLAPMASALGALGLSVGLVPLPRGKAERAVPGYRQALEAEAADTAIGGHSFGGRVASLLAAEAAPTPAALVLLSYPLHAPGRHDTWDARTSHWPAIRCPVLLLSGEADPFARIDLLHTAVERLDISVLRTWPRLGHGMGPVLDEAVEEIVRFLASRT